jgi:hypothetical protein
MGHYVNISMKIEDFDTIIQTLMDKTVKEETFFEIHELVNLIDSLQEEYDKDIYAQNVALKKWQDYEELYIEYEKDKENIPSPICFMGVRDILQNYMVEEVEDGLLDLSDPVNMFSLIMEICEFFVDDKEEICDLKVRMR